MMNILITAYDVNPYKGSESATGWNYSFYLSQYHKITTVTRSNNRENIEKYIKESGIDSKNLKFIYFDYPKWMLFWKKGVRGSTLYYYLWQVGVSLKYFSKRADFDIVHALNFHSDRTPSFLWLLNRKFIWGPINHHEMIPHHFMKIYGYREQSLESLKWIVKWLLWNVDPWLWICKKKANKVIAGHSLVGKRLHCDANTLILSQVAADKQMMKKVIRRDAFVIVSVGRIIPIKGFDLVVSGFANFIDKYKDRMVANIKLELIGEGPYLQFIKELCQKLGIEHYVEFKGWVAKPVVLENMSKASVFCFPSHEGAGMVIAESLSVGTPIICLDNYGPGQLVNEQIAIKVDAKSYESTVEGISNAIASLYFNPDLLDMMSDSAKKYFNKNLTWEVKASQISQVYESVFDDKIR